MSKLSPDSPSHANANHFPSGDKLGSTFEPGRLVTGMLFSAAKVSLPRRMKYSPIRIVNTIRTMRARCPPVSQPMKGTAVISVLKPVTKVKGNEVVTVLTVKNSSYGAIGGLRVDEYWYDKAGNIIGGDSQRMKKLLQPDETYVFELHTPKDPKMNRNSYQFSHINGKVRADSVPKF